MAAFVDNLTRRLVRRGLRLGLLEGRTAWLVVGALAGLARLLLRKESPRVIREELRLGESIVVTHLPAKSQRNDEGPTVAD